MHMFVIDSARAQTQTAFQQGASFDYALQKHIGCHDPRGWVSKHGTAWGPTPATSEQSAIGGACIPEGSPHWSVPRLLAKFAACLMFSYYFTAFYLMTLSVAQVIHHRMTGWWQWMMNWKRFGSKRPWRITQEFAFREWKEKVMENLSQDGRSPSRDSSFICHPTIRRYLVCCWQRRNRNHAFFISGVAHEPYKKS